MESHPFRFRLRSLVLLVALLALVLGGVAEMSRRRRLHLEKAAWHREMVLSCQKELDDLLSPDGHYRLMALENAPRFRRYWTPGTPPGAVNVEESPEDRNRRLREAQAIRARLDDLPARIKEHQRLARYHQDRWW